MSFVRRGALAALLVVAGCGGGKQGGAPAAVPRPVRTLVSATEPLPRTLPVTGVLAAQEELVLGMQVGGRLLELSADVGDLVEAGSVLARLDARDFELQVAHASAALRAARARLGLDPGEDVARIDPAATAPVREAQAVLAEAKLQRDRTADLVQEQLRPTAELETADAALAVAESRLQRAREDVQTLLAEAAQSAVELAQAQKRLHDAQLVAPWRGRIAARQATAGEVLAAGAPVVTLVRTDPLRLRLPVSERSAAEVKLGQPVRFTVDGLDGPPREGTVSRLGAVVERGNRTRLVEATVANADGMLLPGAFCRADIVVVAAEPVLVVPKTAIATFAGVSRVFLVAGEPSRAEGRIVQLGRDLGDRWEIVQGLETGTPIVAEPGDLRQGDLVAAQR